MSDIDEYPRIKSDNAGLLNALVEMQQSPAYAFRRGTLLDAERVIVAQERRIDELEATEAKLRAMIPSSSFVKPNVAR